MRNQMGSIFDGAGIRSGLEYLKPLPLEGDIRTIVLHALLNALSFLALAATIAIIVAGIYLIVGGGSEEWRMKAKKTIIWTIVGLLIVFFSRVIVGFFTIALPSFT